VRLAVVIVSYRRASALRTTLAHLAQLGVPGIIVDTEIIGTVIVVDNASGDDTAAMVRRDFPAVTLIELAANVGVEAFNVGAKSASGEVLLILDDDAWPAEGVLQDALGAMQRDAALAAIALVPVHPGSGQAEWPFVREPLDAFPFMGCANLVRREAWAAAGGYQREFFLYRNDTDLALTLLAQGRHVRCDPAWRAWHDSPAAAAKSERWLWLATRNWIWLCRRHGRGRAAVMGVLGGVARAMMHAGLSPRRLACVARGVWRGFFSPAPIPVVPNTGAGLRRLLEVRRGVRTAQK
jgi:GT2 family glycosyltransferase